MAGEAGQIRGAITAARRRPLSARGPDGGGTGSTDSTLARALSTWNTSPALQLLAKETRRAEDNLLDKDGDRRCVEEHGYDNPRSGAVQQLLEGVGGGGGEGGGFWGSRVGVGVGVGCFVLFVLFSVCLTSKQNTRCVLATDLLRQVMYCHSEAKIADQTCYLIQSQHTETGPTSSSVDLVMPDVRLDN